MCAAYAFARRVDDIADGTLSEEEKLNALEEAERSLAALTDPTTAMAVSGDPVLVALIDARERFAFEPRTLVELVEGVRMDVRGASYEDFDQLVLYCRHVAGTIGRVCLSIFTDGAPLSETQTSLADDLGVAFQLTNILRDVREDAETGRVYLPAEDLRRFAVITAGDEPRAPAMLASIARASAGLVELVGFEAERAEQWFRRGIGVVELLDRRSGACVGAMAGIYRRVLERVAADPQRALRERVSLPAPEKAWVAARAMARGAR
jgi:phytoene synthase